MESLKLKFLVPLSIFILLLSFNSQSAMVMSRRCFYFAGLWPKIRMAWQPKKLQNIHFNYNGFMLDELWPLENHFAVHLALCILLVLSKLALFV